MTGKQVSLHFSRLSKDRTERGFLFAGCAYWQFGRSGEDPIAHGCPAPFHDDVVGDMAACAIWCVLVSRVGYCSMA